MFLGSERIVSRPPCCSVGADSPALWPHYYRCRRRCCRHCHCCRCYPLAVMDLLQTSIQNDIDLHAANVRALALRDASRPTNTVRAYRKHQEEWEMFCRRRGFDDGGIVTENKLLVFLQEEVLNRPLRGKRMRDIGDTDTRLGASSVETYVSAVVSIYDNQVTRGLNRNPHPRGPAVKATLETHGRRERQRRRDAYEDREKGTIQ